MWLGVAIGTDTKMAVFSKYDNRSKFNSQRNGEGDLCDHFMLTSLTQ